MAFNPRTDVVLEVASAADPSRASLAAQRLNAIAGSNATPADFVSSLNQAAGVANAPPSSLPGGADARSRLAEAANEPEKLGKAKTQFEAMMLNSFVGELLPKDSGEVFGQGMAGDMWRSMLAEQVSTQIAKSGKLGLARRLFATHEVGSHPGRIGEAAKTVGASAAQMSANILSAPAAAEPENGAVLFAGRKRT
ncbi:MAG TPA: rod-binding protein [Roseiarcus sp.]|jgi:Rod binding domain-containing protein|nr:rod-binding protein [Roseiarcus sp.]